MNKRYPFVVFVFFTLVSYVFSITYLLNHSLSALISLLFVIFISLFININKYELIFTILIYMIIYHAFFNKGY
jgi:hypothetical protein